ncbi:hypothetical protein KXS15_25865 [Sinorhizobium meliloti]|uniref:hypothetical protein n=1 Tax=Rhizobium meliloti TaxID=382 RepID=UPI003F1889AF
MMQQHGADQRNFIGSEWNCDFTPKLVDPNRRHICNNANWNWRVSNRLEVPRAEVDADGQHRMALLKAGEWTTPVRSLGEPSYFSCSSKMCRSALIVKPKQLLSSPRRRVECGSVERLFTHGPFVLIYISAAALYDDGFDFTEGTPMLLTMVFSPQ